MNKHYEAAAGFIDEATDASVWSIEQQPTVASMAIAEATLALAYEQRTANLIAMLGQVEEQTYEWLKRAQDVPNSDEAKQLARYKSIGQQVKERLNLA
ncbi:hypothetical protein KKR91_01285 [Arthrobacter jiangjiafuii]|uniref:Uncharacterized protein n=1 Tax=Arthrobacter jiangjiafuii TaxID=2817475 RepID=A0A975M5L2_9MICC|nr:hypothetical protein [Arthrobacter jiangjiafuii]MBP3044859.1 hypothetical protein [Arthrobacter jiangjiafuii]QWC10317.1 hypothetical protein KKR91_01285 [Arthrobacter jiangjiafuii]